MFHFTIKGKVKAKQSVKFANIGGFIKKYTPADVVEYANYVRLCFMHAYPLWRPHQIANKPLKVLIMVYYPIPKSFSKKKQKEADAGAIRPTVKPDCDNIAKNICDALNGVVYPDDKQVVSLVVRKVYTTGDERVEVEIETEEMSDIERKIRGLKV